MTHVLREFAWRKVLLLASLVACGPLGSVWAATVTVGPAGQPEALAAALRQAQDGDTIVLLPGEYKGVNATLTHKKLTIRGDGERPVFIANGQAAENKAIFVVRGGDIRLENIEFRGVRVADTNGAGVRLDRGRLTVVRCHFIDNENGLLTNNEVDSELTIESSVFGLAPRVVGRLHHLLYVGRIGKFSITGSRFSRGFEGHLIKSRARSNFIGYNLLRDSGDGEASYEIDLPVGGQAIIIGNVINQGPRTQHPVVVSYGSEGQAWEKNSLVMSHNTLISEGWRPAWFARVWRDRVSGMDEPLFVNNLSVGVGVFWLGAKGHFSGNWPASLNMLADVTTHGFELRPGSWLRGRAVDPRSVRGQDLAPKFEFDSPAGVRPLAQDRATWSPGAFQR